MKDTNLLDCIKFCEPYGLFKFDFAVAGTQESPRKLGNRIILPPVLNIITAYWLKLAYKLQHSKSKITSKYWTSYHQFNQHAELPRKINENKQ